MRNIEYHDSGRPRVLNVGGDESRRFATRILEQAGYAVLEASSGREAIERAIVRPDIVLLDGGVSETETIEICRRLKARRDTADASIIRVTDTRDRIPDEDVTADAVLVRSASARELLATVQTVLRARRSDGLRERAARLEAADEYKNQFLAILAHEIRSPLAAISAGIEVLGTSPLSGGDRGHTSDVLRHEVGKLRRLVDDLLDISRISRGTLGLKLATADLARCVGDAVECCRTSIESATHALDVDIRCAPLYARIDATRVEQIVTNIVDNAVKYTEPGGRITIRLDALHEADRHWAELSVGDTGRGIARDRLETVFDPFSQTDRTPDRTRGGLGLGLSLVKQLVTMHAGRIWAESEGEGMGSRFVVRLPIDNSLVPLPHARAENEASHEPRTVLLVDDSEDLRVLLAMSFERAGHRVLQAECGRAALDIADRELPDVALVDLELPDLSGFDVAHALRCGPRTARVHLVALSGYGGEQDVKASLRAGFSRHFIKPVPIEELLAYVGGVRS